IEEDRYLAFFFLGRCAPMHVSFNCPTGHRLTAPLRHAGKTVRCPQCGETVRLPSQETIERKLREKRQAALRRERAVKTVPPVSPQEALSAPGVQAPKQDTSAKRGGQALKNKHPAAAPS